jgi:capsular exopolysaccharide synthesis family protein
MREDQQTIEPSFSTYGRTLRRRVWWVIGTTVIVAGAALGYSLYQTKTYTATATLQVQGATGGAAKGAGNALAQQVQSDVEVMQSYHVKQNVKTKLGLPTPPPVMAQSSGTNDLFTVSSTAPTPGVAALYANTYASQYQLYETSLVLHADAGAEQALTGQISTLKSQIAAIVSILKRLGVGAPTATGKPGALTPTESSYEQELTTLNANRATLQNSLTQIEISSKEATSGALVISPAQAPKGPSSPKTSRNVALGLIVGIILGLILAFAVDALDDTIKSKEDIDRAYPKLPNLGVIPVVDSWKVATVPYLVSLKAPLSHATEAYRSLRTAVEFARLHRSVKSIVVTSSMDFEGKTSTVANLGVIFAKAGQRTLIVSADLRRPRMGNFLGASDDIGLASVALGLATFDEAITPVGDVPGLYYLGTGPLPAEAAEFLSSRKVEEIFRSLRERFDVVLIDTPPAVLVTDAMIMSRYVDAVILVVAQGRTRRRSLARARELCAQVDAPVIGTILNGAATKGADSYGYGYGYRYRYGRVGYGYGQSQTPGSEPPRSKRAAKKQMKTAALPPRPAQPTTSVSVLDAESEQTGS